jgi:hypothetical protein
MKALLTLAVCWRSPALLWWLILTHPHVRCSEELHRLREVVIEADGDSDGPSPIFGYPFIPNEAAIRATVNRLAPHRRKDIGWNLQRTRIGDFAYRSTT